MTHFAIPRFFSLWIDLRGQDLIEYALLAAMVAAMAVALFPAIDSALEPCHQRFIGSAFNHGKHRMIF